VSDSQLAVTLGTLREPWTRNVADALQDLDRYAFGVRSGAVATTSDVRRYAYWSYDCSPRSGQLDAAEIAIANSLNAQMSNADMAQAYAASEQVNRYLAMIPPGTRLWSDLDPRELSRDAGEAHSQVADAIRGAWKALSDRPGLKLALVHKILHRLRPLVFPVLDAETRLLLEPTTGADTYGQPGLWASVHADLVAAPDAWAELELRFAALASEAGNGAVSLSRLRLHDILVWTRATDRTG